MFEHDILSNNDHLSLPYYNDEVNSMVLLKDTVYLRDRYGGQILSYSLTERSWDANISTPEEAVSGYQLAVCSNNLVLVGGHVESITGHRRKTSKVWVRQGIDSEWNADIIPPVPVDEVLAVAGHDHNLFVLCKQSYNNCSSEQNTCILYCCDDGSTEQWLKPLKGPSITCSSNCRPSASIIVHNSNVLTMYAVIYFSKSNIFFRGHITVASDNISFCDIEWREIDSKDFCSCAYLTISGDNLIVAKLDGKVKLYTPFENKLVDVDELDLAFAYPLHGITGLSDGSLVVIGDARKSYSDVSSLKSAVVQFKAKGTAPVSLLNLHGMVYLWLTKEGPL